MSILIQNETTATISKLGDLTDVSISENPSEDQVLMFDYTANSFIPQTLPSSGATTLNDLTDVDVSNPSDGQSLVFDGNSWKPETIASSSGGATTLGELTNQKLTISDDLTNDLNFGVNNTASFIKHTDASSTYALRFAGGSDGDVKVNDPTNTGSTVINGAEIKIGKSDHTSSILFRSDEAVEMPLIKTGYNSTNHTVNQGNNAITFDMESSSYKVFEVDFPNTNNADGVISSISITNAVVGSQAVVFFTNSTASHKLTINGKQSSLATTNGTLFLGYDQDVVLNSITESAVMTIVVKTPNSYQYLTCMKYTA